MLTFAGIGHVIESRADLPDYGFIYTARTDDAVTHEGLAHCTFTLPETEQEELWIENNDAYSPWLESPTLVDIIDAYTLSHHDATIESLINAVVYYWEHDDFYS